MNAGIFYTIITILGIGATYFIARFWSRSVGPGGNTAYMGLMIGLMSYFLAMLPMLLRTTSVVVAVTLNVLVLCAVRYYGTKLLFPGGLTPSASLYLGLGFALFAIAAPMVFGGVWKLSDAMDALEVSSQVLLTVCTIVIFICIGVITGYAIHKKELLYILGMVLVQTLYVLPNFITPGGSPIFSSNLLFMAYNAVVAGATYYYTRLMYNRWKAEAEEK